MTGAQQLLTPLELRRLIGNGESVVMCLPRPHLSARLTPGVALEVGQDRSRPPVANAPVPVRRIGVVEIGGHLHSAHPQQPAEEGVGPLDVGPDGGDVVPPARAIVALIRSSSVANQHLRRRRNCHQRWQTRPPSTGTGVAISRIAVGVEVDRTK
jgi:hypothetical protein